MLNVLWAGRISHVEFYFAVFPSALVGVSWGRWKGWKILSSASAFDIFRFLDKCIIVIDPLFLLNLNFLHLIYPKTLIIGIIALMYHVLFLSFWYVIHHPFKMLSHYESLQLCDDVLYLFINECCVYLTGEAHQKSWALQPSDWLIASIARLYIEMKCQDAICNAWWRSFDRNVASINETESVQELLFWL